ncbi:MAG: NAD(P)H-hydrate dehydratase, partial [Gemmatimonadaceae bacterium]
GVVVDGLLGTGARGEPRGKVAAAVASIAASRSAGAAVVSLDVPSGVDATTGAADGAVRADLTLTFGSMKRGLLVARHAAGTVAVLDIGLLPPAAADEPLLVDAAWVHALLPAIVAEAHKGTRRKVVVVGGATGMAGAAVLAARAAIASGIGMVRLLVSQANVSVVQAVVPEAMAGEWPRDDEDVDGSIGEWADVVLIGPGLAHDDAARSVVERVLRRWRGPVVLDADAINVFAGRVAGLAALLGGRPALLTPHPGEFARLTGRSLAGVLDDRFDAGRELAGALGAAVLLKGVPTVLASADGRRLVSAAGTPALAAAGSGDVLGGIAATLVAQMPDALHAGACAAWAHGRAAELASGGADARGVVLADVLAALPRVWRESPTVSLLPVLAELPAVS